MAKFKATIKDYKLILKVKLSRRYKERINEQRLDYFQKKDIHGLLKIEGKNWNTIVYSGPKGITLFERLHKPISKHDFFYVMEQIIDTYQKLDVNSLKCADVLWDVNNVFINEGTKELQFVYLPLEINDQEVDIIGFMHQIMYSVTPILEEDASFVSRFSMFLKSLSEFDADRIESFILQEDKSVVSIIKKKDVRQSGFITNKPQQYYDHYDNDDTALLGEDYDDTMPLNSDSNYYDGDTDYLNENDEDETGFLDCSGDETGLLSESTSGYQYASMYRHITNEIIAINKPVFRFGKEKSYSDYFVSNNNMVSRSHADIISRNGRFFIIDLNSKNKTFVNDVPIPVQQEYEIHNGDEIRLANEEFEFRT